jgi:hypothetical protein
MRSWIVVWSPVVAQPPRFSARDHTRANTVPARATQTRSTVAPRAAAFASQAASAFDA